jgi:hypothetical protein
VRGGGSDGVLWRGTTRPLISMQADTFQETIRFLPLIDGIMAAAAPAGHPRGGSIIFHFRIRVSE